MAKTKEELNALKEEFETVNKKLVELSEDELKNTRSAGKKRPIIFPRTKQNCLRGASCRALRCWFPIASTGWKSNAAAGPFMWKTMFRCAGKTILPSGRISS